MISATHRDLHDEIAANRFREDLFYRLNVVSIALPALSERRDDVPLLANHFLATLAGKYQKHVQGFAPEAARAALAWGFHELDLPNDEIVSFTTVANVKSQRVMQKLGMRHDVAGDFDHPLLPDWAGRRHVLYRLTRREFVEDHPTG